DARRRGLFALCAAVPRAPVVSGAAEARRRGGGRPRGAQRQAVPDKPATPPAAQQAQAAPATNPAAAAAAKRPMSPWLGALAGLAAGLGLAYLFGEQLGAILMGILLAAAAVAVIGLVARAFLRPRTPAPAPPRLQYAPFA